MTPISENGKRSTGSKRKSVNPISPGEMDHTARRGFGFLVVSAVIVVWFPATGKMGTWVLQGWRSVTLFARMLRVQVYKITQ